jgi:hypothetical protein
MKMIQQMRFFVFTQGDALPHFCTVQEVLQSTCRLNLMLRHLLVIHILLLSLAVHGQGWERIYSGGAQDEAKDVVLTPDGGYAMSGYYSVGTSALMIKVDENGFQQWNKLIAPPVGHSRISANALIATPDGGYMLAGYADSTVQSFKQSFLMKVDAEGAVIWRKKIRATNTDEFHELVRLQDGSLVMVGYATLPSGFENVRVVKTDADGNVIWDRQYGDAAVEERAFGVVLATNGDIVVAGFKKEAPLPRKNIYVVRMSATTGDLVWEQEYSIASNVDDEAQAIIRTNDGHFVVAGYTQANIASNGLILKINENGSSIPFWFQTFANVEALNDVTSTPTGHLLATGFKEIPGSMGALSDLFIVRTDANGSTIWATTAGKEGPDYGNAVLPTPDGGAVAVGATLPNLNTPASYAYMVKTDGNGNLFTNYIQGKIYVDDNNDCTVQSGESGLNNWLIRVESPDFTRYVTSNDAGNYVIMVDTGIYKVTVFTPNDSWEACDLNQTVEVNTFYDTIWANVGVSSIYACPRNEVDVQTPILRRCTDNTYTVRYCNNGPATSSNTVIEVLLSSGLTITSSSQPYTTSNDTVRFSIGTLPSRQCGTLTFDAFLDCNVELGTAHCVQTRILPDSFCAPATNWDGSILEARAQCDSGRVKMFIKNKGIGDIGDVVGYVVIQDVILLTIPEGVINTLPPGNEIKVWDEPANNRTYRLIAEQTSGYPGVSVPTAALEGCKTDTTTTPMSTGFYTMFPEDDAEPFLASDCQEAYEPDFNPTFLKRGHPRGYEALHYIDSLTNLKYLLHFLNNTNDTVTHVVVRDTLSQWLDPTTVRPGSASHPYDYNMYGTGAVEFVFKNITLPPGEAGYVKFEVAQQHGLQPNTRIENTASVVFNYGAPQLTNQTFHTVGLRDSFIMVDSRVIHFDGADLRVYPNPFVHSAMFEVSGVTAKEYFLEVFDVQGRLLFNRSFTDSTFQLFRHQLPNGQHFFRLSADGGRLLATGQLIVHGY